jgi:hypothetical protein
VRFSIIVSPGLPGSARVTNRPTGSARPVVTRRTVTRSPWPWAQRRCRPAGFPGHPSKSNREPLTPANWGSSRRHCVEDQTLNHDVNFNGRHALPSPGTGLMIERGGHRWSFGRDRHGAKPHDRELMTRSWKSIALLTRTMTVLPLALFAGVVAGLGLAALSVRRRIQSQPT